MAVRLTGQGAPDLAKVLRDAGLKVDESVVPDWRLRSRTSNTSWYKDPGPTHVMVHHTATPTTSHVPIAMEKREAYICAITHTVKPVSNVYVGPTRTFYPLAGGPSNTNGEGLDTWGGGTPKDSMNSYAIAFEYGNNGIGEPYSGWLDLVTAVAACCVAYKIPVGHVRSHFEWAPTRKIDMAGGRNYNGIFARTTPDAYGRIDMDKFRAAVFNVIVAPPPDPPPPDLPIPPYVPGVTDVKFIIRYTAYGSNPAGFKGNVDFAAGDGPDLVWIQSADIRNAIVAAFKPQLVQLPTVLALKGYVLNGPIPKVKEGVIMPPEIFAAVHP